MSQGQKEEAINISNGEMQKRINEAAGQAEAIKLVADATAKSISLVAEAINGPGGSEALKMRMTEKYIAQMSEVIRENDVTIFPTNLATLKGIFDEMKRPSWKDSSATVHADV